MVEKEEAGGAQYDLQIRLWGLEAQKRLRASWVLLVGMKGLGAETAKTLILAGVKGLTMLDHEHVSPEDPGAQFLIHTGSVGRNRAEASLVRAQNLNPMVDVQVDTEDIEKFDAVCLTCCSRDVIVKVDQICHRNSIKFFTGDVFGYHGYTFANFGEHEFVKEKNKVAKFSHGVEDGPVTKRAKLDSSETIIVKKKVIFCPVKETLEVDWSSEKAKASLKHTAPDYFLLQVLLKFHPNSETYGKDAELVLVLPVDFVGYCFSETAPVCSVVGGILAQEFVKVLSQRDPPHNDFFFDSMKGSGIVGCLGPK
uniref:SUMO-activating enzyme subunit 1 n=1 Tax=Nannospalax galili TaxID=1026970 RepID=A0A8C6WAE4_NANGA